MARAGQIVLFRFPQTDMRRGKLRPALIIIRVGRLAVVDVSMLLGSIGEIDPHRLTRVKANLAGWLNILDADVLDWFKAQGKGYQTRINAVLRVYMDAQTA